MGDYLVSPRPSGGAPVNPGYVELTGHKARMLRKATRTLSLEPRRTLD